MPEPVETSQPLPDPAGDDESGAASSADGPSARDALIQWANEQDSWVREIVDLVLKSGGPLGDTAVDAVFGRYLAEKGLSGETVEPVAALSSAATDTASGTALALECLSDVTGVNALAPGQTIKFNPGLTIVFGENGSGKTGYTRILKALADVRTVEEILPDVNDQGKVAAQECLVSYQEGGRSDSYRWQGETGVPPFTAISIFDSPAVALHVDDALNYVYTPGDLGLFEVVGKVIEEVQQRLGEAITARSPKGNPFLSHFTNGTSVYAQVETLGASTDLAALGDLVRAGKDAEAERDSKQTTVDALRGGAVDAQIAASRGRRDLARRLAEIAKMTEDFQVELYAAAITELSNADSSYATIRSSFAAESGAQGDGVEIWQDFILAGEAYRRHLLAHDVAEPEVCNYCRQALDEAAARRLETYRQFADDAARQRLEAARDTVDRLTRNILGADLAGIRDALGAALETDPDNQDLNYAEAFLAGLDASIARIRSGSAVDWEELGEQASATRAKAERLEAEENELLETLAAKRTERVERLATAQSELAELSDRLQLGERFEAIRQHVEDAKWAEKAAKLSGLFRKLSASLTATVKAASASLLNNDFERRFEDERKALRAPEVGLAFPGRRGAPARRKTVSANHKPSKVLSEGEQKVIALADFLAEVSLRSTPVPVVFDDPVNSLDYRRLADVAERISVLAEERQVVVFTHNIWLTVELLAKFESNRDRCTYYRVTDEAGKGLIVEGSHPRWDTVKATAGSINAILQEARSAEGETREALVERAYSRMRSWSEVVVEQELFRGVSGRFVPNVAMGKLSQVRPDRLQEAIDTINPIFEKACRVMDGHSQPLESLGHAPTLEEAEEDWKALTQARDTYIA